MTRKLKIQLKQQTPKAEEVILTPIATSLADARLLEKDYTVTTNDSGYAEIVLDTGVTYRYFLPRLIKGVPSVERGDFFLDEGGDVWLHEIVLLGQPLTTPIERFLTDLVGTSISDHVAALDPHAQYLLESAAPGTIRGTTVTGVAFDNSDQINSGDSLLEVVGKLQAQLLDITQDYDGGASDTVYSSARLDGGSSNTIYTDYGIDGGRSN